MLAWLLHKQTPKVCLQLSRLPKLGKTQVSEIVSVKNNGMHCHPTLQAKFEAVNSRVTYKWLPVTVAQAIVAQAIAVLAIVAQETVAQETVVLAIVVLVTVAPEIAAQEIVALATVAPETGVQAKP